MATERFNQFQVYERLSRATGKWLLYCVHSTDGEVPFDEAVKAIPWLKWPDDARYIVEGFIAALCDTEAECLNLYNQVVGDDGPTATNPYNGPARWYACTYSPTKGLMNENT